MAKKAHRWAELLRLVDNWPGLVGVFPLSKNEAEVICQDGSTAFIDWNGEEWTEYSQRPRADLPPDAEEWMARLEAKSEESLELSRRIWEKTGLPATETSAQQVQRTLAGIRPSGRLDRYTAAASARRCGLFEPDEADKVARAMESFQDEISLLLWVK